MKTNYLIWAWNSQNPGANQLYAKCETDIEVTRILTDLCYETGLYNRFSVEDRKGRIVLQKNGIKPLRSKL